MKRFDRKFGAAFLTALPTTPAVYLYRNGAGEVIYVGKAKNIRRRLSSYRNASRRKAHRKMRMLVREASSLEVRLQESERQALRLENRLIRELRPAFNVDGAYAFLYPAIGLARRERHTLLCFTTDTAAWEAYDLRWYGCFRSRSRAKQAFDTLVELLGLLAHRERGAAALGEPPDLRGSRIVALRQLDPELFAAVQDWLAGEGAQALAILARALVEKPRARREASEVQSWLWTLRDFSDSDLVKLRDALRRAGRPGHFVPQDERDTLFIDAGRSAVSRAVDADRDRRGS